MGVKYTIPFKANDNVSWRVDISTLTYSDLPVSVRGVSEQCATLAYDGGTDDPYYPIVKSTLTLKIFDTANIDVNEMQTAQDRDFTVSVYREGLLNWTGYLVPDGIQQPLKQTPYDLSITAICGLSMLDNMNYVHTDLPGLEPGYSRCPMNYIRDILFNNLGIILPIRWSNSVICTAFSDDDVFAGQVAWAANNEGFYSYQSGQDGNDQGPVKSCGYILSGILSAFQCRIYQSQGKWRIRRVNDVASGIVRYKEIAGTLGVMVLQSSTEDLRDHIGISGYRMINEDHIITVKQGIKTCRVTYNANVRENILPNGNQDQVISPIVPQPTIWQSVEPFGILTNSLDSLDGRFGYSTELRDTVGDNHYQMGPDLQANGLPIDTKVLVPRISFGFLFSPTVFPFAPITEVIDWSSKPLQLQVVLNLFGTRYFLNDFGYWQTDEVFITIVVDGMRLNDVAQINFDKFQGIVMPEPTNRPEAGDESDLQVVFLVKVGTTYVVDNIKVTIDSGNDIYESTFEGSRNTTVDERELTLSSAYPGYFVSNFMTSPFNSDTECFFEDALVYSGTLTGLCAAAIMRFRYKSSRIFNGSILTFGKNWDFDTIWTIDTMSASRFLPLNASYNIEKCEVNNLVAMECRNDNAIFTEKYYSSNDKPLSN